MSLLLLEADPPRVSGSGAELQPQGPTPMLNSHSTQECLSTAEATGMLLFHLLFPTKARLPKHRTFSLHPGFTLPGVGSTIQPLW